MLAVKCEYEITISVDMGSVLAPVGDLVNGVNNELSKFGCDEKLSVRSPMISMALTTEREITDDEKEKMKTMMLAEINSQHPAWKAKVESFRRKSGNVQQSIA